MAAAAAPREALAGLPALAAAAGLEQAQRLAADAAVAVADGDEPQARLAAAAVVRAGGVHAASRTLCDTHDAEPLKAAAILLLDLLRLVPLEARAAAAEADATGAVVRALAQNSGSAEVKLPAVRDARAALVVP